MQAEQDMCRLYESNTKNKYKNIKPYFEIQYIM